MKYLSLILMIVIGQGAFAGEYSVDRFTTIGACRGPVAQTRAMYRDAGVLVCVALRIPGLDEYANNLLFDALEKDTTQNAVNLTVTGEMEDGVLLITKIAKRKDTYQ